MIVDQNCCGTCATYRSGISETRREITHLIRIAESSPGTGRAKAAIARIPKLKERLKSSQQILADHEKESA